MRFNEAEAIKPRNPVPLAHMAPIPYPSFNEAEAIKPRNPGDRGPGSGEVGCFNEAEAIKPRNQWV